MRWWKRSVRRELLTGAIGKRGQASEEPEAGRGKRSLKSFFTIIFVILILSVIVVVLYGYLTGEKGQRAVADIGAKIWTFSLDTVTDFYSSIFGVARGDYFSSSTNASSSKKGIDLVDFRSTVGETVLGGKDFTIEYLMEFYEIPSGKSFDATFECHFNKTETEKIYGDIIPATEVNLLTTSRVLCQIPGETTKGIDKPVTFYGSFTFEFETKDATLLVYLIPFSVARQLGDKDFFEAYDLDVSPSDLRTVYNGEPISIAIGVGGGVTEQPVIVGTADESVFNTVGITLTNEWNGDIAELKTLTLKLPEGVELNEEYNEEPSLQLCPFISGGQEGGYNVYTLADSVQQEMFDNYFGPTALLGSGEFFGKQDYHTFICAVTIDESILGDASYVAKAYSTSATYRYKVKEKLETITIKEME